MEAFHKIKIKCPYEILEIEEIKIKNKPNEHGYLYLKGIVDDSVNFKYAIEASTEDKICIYEETENEEESVIFYGTIQNISTNNNIDGIYHIEIEAYTSSFDLDIEEKSRSFQDIEMSYDDFLNIIMTDFQMYDYTQCMKKPESIGFPRFQYKESSYRMIVRTASYLGINVYCDIINPSNAFFFGKPSGREYELEDDIDYTATLDINKYRESLVHNPDSHPTDFFYYEIKTPKVMHIGYNVTFKQKKFYIYSYEAEYVRGELIYTYRLCREKGIWQDKIYNDKLKGISLEGKVLEVSGEQVKLHLNIDENQDQAKAAWFRYAPPTGNIMYSMPIVGTSANLYFPNERNEEPIVIGCVRKNGSSCEMFSDVNNRYFSTESGNNLDLLPDAINFSRPGLSANFNDGSGITLKSSSSLSINAGYVGMFAGNISITGTEKLVAEKGSSIISLENDFYNSAGIIKENGSDRASNPKFTDDEPTNGAMEAKAAMEKMMNTSALVAANEASIPLSGEALETRNDIPEFDKNCQYPDGALVKKQMDDGTYVLGKASSPNNKKVSIFEALDKDAVAEHTSLKDELKSYGYGILGGMNKFSTGCRQSMDWIGEHVLGLDYDRPNGEGGKSYREIAQEADARDEAAYNELREKAPCKSQFDDASHASETTLNVTSLVTGAYGIKQTAKSGISYFKANEPYIKAMSSELKNDASMLNQAIKNVNRKPPGMTFGSNGGNASKYLSDVKEEFDSLKNLKPGVKVTNQSEGSSSGEIEDLIDVSKANLSVDEIWNIYKRDIIQSNTEGKNPAQYMAQQLNKLNSEGKISKRKMPNTISVLELDNGDYLFSKNNEGNQNEELNRILDRLGNENAYNRKCSEVNIIAKAMNKKVNLKGAKIYVSYVEKTGSKNEYRNGQFKIPCDVCGPMLDELQIEVIEW